MAPACITCDQFNAAHKLYLQSYGNIEPVESYLAEDSIAIKNNALYVCFMNAKLGQNKSLTEYLAFKATCMAANATLCEELGDAI